MKKTLVLGFAAALITIPGLMVGARYEPPFLSCAATYPVVSVGNAGRFQVVTNTSGPFMWVVESEDYAVYDAGPQFITPFTRAGLQEVAVVWGSKRATCIVEVVPMPGFGEPYRGPALSIEPYGDFPPLGDIPGPFGMGPNVTLGSAYYPSLPNAGFGPTTFAAFAFAAVLLIAAGVALHSHVRKAFAIVTR